MSNKLFETKGELRKVLRKDLKDIETMKKEDRGISGIGRVIKRIKK